MGTAMPVPDVNASGHDMNELAALKYCHNVLTEREKAAQPDSEECSLKRKVAEYFIESLESRSEEVAGADSSLTIKGYI